MFTSQNYVTNLLNTQRFKSTATQ